MVWVSSGFGGAAQPSASTARAVGVTLDAQQLHWLLCLAQSRVRKQRNRLANVEEREGESWHFNQLLRSLGAMEDALEVLEAAYEDVEEA